MTILRTTGMGTIDEYLEFQQFQKWLVIVNTTISSIVFLLVAFVALAYVRKLQERGMMVYLIGLTLLSQAIYLCISWTVLISYWDILGNKMNAPVAYQAMIKFQLAQNGFTGVFTFLFILEHAYFATKYWALSKKVETMIDQTESDSEIFSKTILWTIAGFTATSTSTMIYFMDVMPATQLSTIGVFAAQVITLACSFAVCCVMGDALRRIYNLKGNKLVVSANFLTLQLTGFVLFFLSGAVFVYLYQRPPKSSQTRFACYLTEGIIVNLCQLSFNGMIYRICQKAFTTQQEMQKSNDTSLITGETGNACSNEEMEHKNSLNDDLIDKDERARYGLYGPQILADVSDILQRSKSQSPIENKNNSLRLSETGMIEGFLITRRSQVYE